MAVDARDHRQRAVLQALEQIDDVVSGPREIHRERAALDTLGEIGARAEGLVPGARQHDRATVTVRGRFGNGAIDDAHHFFIERIAPGFAIDGDPLHGAAALELDGVGHALLLRDD